jgi:hypothetical protein
MAAASDSSSGISYPESERYHEAKGRFNAGRPREVHVGPLLADKKGSRAEIVTFHAFIDFRF